MTKNMAASVRQRLLNLSRETGERFQNLLTRCAIERLDDAKKKQWRAFLRKSELGALPLVDSAIGQGLPRNPLEIREEKEPVYLVNRD